MDPAVRDVLPLHPEEPSNSRGKSEGTSEYRSTSKEPYVFRADRPGDLLGVHVDLMGKTLRRDEALLYLLYSPIFPEEKGPFGLCATPGSHAVAVTKHRFVISEDRYMEGISPTVQSIPFDQVFYVKLGNALLLGWFSVEFVVDDKPSCATLFFPATTGMKHFGVAVSEYRRMTGLSHNYLPAKIMNWADIWQHTPKMEVDHLKPLILREELPFNMLRSSERWILRKRRWKSMPVYLSTNGILISSNFGYIQATDEPFIRPEIFSFGVKASCIPFDALKSAQLLQKRMYGRLLPFLRLKIARGNVTVDFDVPFDESNRKHSEDLVHFLARNR
jgi:hypothetical protein